MSSRLHQINPFSKRETHGTTAITTYKVLNALSFLLVLVTSVYYTIRKPHDGKTIGRTIWGQNWAHHTAFALNSVIASIYWVIMFILQIGYIGHLFSKNADYVNAAASVGSHFIVFNLLQFAFVMLFVRSHFVWAELILLISFVNLSSLYFRHSTHPRFIHTPVVSMPLAWTFVAIYWNGAIMIGSSAEHLPARIAANVFIWAILVYGLFYILIFKDYTMGFSLSVLAASLGVGQFLRQFVAFQWIFAFTIMATLFVATLVVALPGAFGKEINFRRDTGVVSEDRERAPLLDDA